MELTHRQRSSRSPQRRPYHCDDRRCQRLRRGGRAGGSAVAVVRAVAVERRRGHGGCHTGNHQERSARGSQARRERNGTTNLLATVMPPASGGAYKRPCTIPRAAEVLEAKKQVDPNGYRLSEVVRPWLFDDGQNPSTARPEYLPSGTRRSHGQSKDGSSRSGITHRHTAHALLQFSMTDRVSVMCPSGCETACYRRLRPGNRCIPSVGSGPCALSRLSAMHRARRQ